MPSLQALEEFKSSFNTIGDEPRTLAELQLPWEEFPLPSDDFSSFASAALPEIAGFDLGMGTGDETEAEGDIFSSFGDLLGDMGSFGGAVGEAETEAGAPGMTEQGDIDFGEFSEFIDTIPDDSAFGLDTSDQYPAFDEGFDTAALLGGFADEIEAGRETAEGESGAEADEELAFDMGDTDTDTDTSNFDFSFGEGNAEDTFASMDIGSEDFGTEAFGTEGFGMDTPPDSFPTDFSDDEDFGFSDESPELDNTAVLEEISGDSFDSFDNFNLDAPAGDFDLGGEEGGGSAIGDDFTLEGAGSIFQGASDPANVALPAAAAAVAGRGFAKKAEVDDVEDIRLTNEELERLQATLSSYPLNLRIACQELIAEKAVDPAKMSRLVNMLARGAAAKETASFAGKILDRTIPIPKGFEKKTGAELEAEQSSFGYIFVHNFLPIFRLLIVITLVVLSIAYLSWRFIYNPIRADRIYQYGLERIHAGEFARANERFWEAFAIHPRRSWFFEYARAFTEARQFTLAEEKYLQLLHFTASRNRRGIPDKAAVLEYAGMVSTVLGHHERADRILRQNLLDFSPNDRDGLLALGDNALAWGAYDPDRFEDARESFARIMEMHGRTDPLLERMLLFFIRTDNLGEALGLQAYFMASARRNISANTLAELGGYLLDKRQEEVRGVPNQFLEHIGGIRDVLLRAIRQNPMLPEAYYHLARYYEYFNNMHDERLTLEAALWVFDAAPEESPQRIRNHINALRRYGEVLIRNREFFRAEGYLERGIRIYEDALARLLLSPAPEFGRLYALMGDMELFVREGDMQAALDYYRLAEQTGWAPPEIQFRMGAAYYHMEQWGGALERFLAAHREVPLNRRILYALANASFLRGNYFAAQGFFDQLLQMLQADQERLPPIWPSDDPRLIDLVERITVAQNNLGVTLEALTERTGDNSFRSRAYGLYTDSARSWDILARDPATMIRMSPATDISAPSVNAGFLNVSRILNPAPGVDPLFFMRIDMDMFEFSEWELLAPPGFRLSEGGGLSR